MAPFDHTGTLIVMANPESHELVCASSTSASQRCGAIFCPGWLGAGTRPPWCEYVCVNVNVVCVTSNTRDTHGTRRRTRAHGSHRRTSQPSKFTNTHKTRTSARRPKPRPTQQPQAQSRPLPAVDSEEAAPSEPDPASTRSQSASPRLLKGHPSPGIWTRSTSQPPASTTNRCARRCIRGSPCGGHRYRCHVYAADRRVLLTYLLKLRYPVAVHEK